MSKKITTSLLLSSLLFTGCIDLSTEVSDDVTKEDKIANHFTTPNSKIITENTKTILTARVSDTNQIIYSISGGADSSKFNIDSSSGVLSFKTNPDFENPTDVEGDNIYEVTIKATTIDLKTTTQDITITVTNIAEVVPVLESLNVSVTQNISLGTIIGNLTVTNSGDSDITLFTLSGDNKDDFEIDTQGAISVKNQLNYITKPTYNLTTTAINEAGHSNEATITITILEPDTTSPVFTSTNSKNISENTTTVLTATATDASEITYSLSDSADSSKFELNSTSGILTLKTPADFENPADANSDNIYEVTLQATDSSQNSTSKDVNITITDIADIAPTIEPFTITIKENTLVGSKIGDINITNSGDSEINIFTLSGNDFDINSSGAILVKNALSFALQPLYNLTASATNSAGSSNEVTVTINIEEVTDVIPKTGQTTSKLDFDDGYYQKGLDRTFTKVDDIVTDPTNLQWQDIPEIDGTNKDINYTTALSYCTNLDGGWRVPTVKELLYLTDKGKNYGVYDEAFINRQTGNSAFYWSSTQSAFYPERNWGVWFSDGATEQQDKANLGQIRCVLGTKKESTFTRDEIFEIVTDHTTNLIWQDDVSVAISSGEKTWDDAITFCENLDINSKTNWRVPNFNELYSIVDTSRENHAINPVFQNVNSVEYYWSSTLDNLDNTQVWNIGFNRGNIKRLPIGTTSTTRYIRCVHSAE